MPDEGPSEGWTPPPPPPPTPATTGVVSDDALPDIPSRRRRRRLHVSPWLIAGVALVAPVAFVALSLAGDDPSLRPRDASVLTLYTAAEGVVGDAAYVRTGSTAATDRALHDELWAEWSEMIPPYWSRRVERFEIASDGSGGIAAAVQRLDDDGERWLLSVDPVDAVERRDEYVHTLVHELAHIVTLGEGRVDVERFPAATLVEQTERCDGRPAVPEGCAADGSVLAAFTERFWDLSVLGGSDGVATRGDREEATIERFLTQRDSFVSAYAASDPVEDLAETITAMTLGDAQARGSVAAEKVEFVRADPELFALADRIRAALRER